MRFVRMKYQNGETRLVCSACGIPAVRNGYKDGRQRWKCPGCGKGMLEDAKFRRLGDKDRRVIGLLMRDGCSPTIVARAFGINRKTIQQIVEGQDE